MTVKIAGKPRPTIPYEHPTLSMHWHNLKQNVQRQIIKGARYSRHDAALQATFSNDETGLAYLCEQLMRYVSEAFVHYAVWD